MTSSATNFEPAKGRLEDLDLLTGRARFNADLPVPGLRHLCFVRSTQSHADLVAVSLEAARQMPGVVAVFDSSDLEGILVKPGPLAQMLPAVVYRPALAAGRVRFVGEMVAAVVADTLVHAVDAAEAVEIDYDPLPVAVGLDAVDPSGPILFPELGSNVVLHLQMEAGSREGQPGVSIRESIANPRMAVAPMEGNSITVIPDGATGPLLVYASTQTPHALRDYLAEFLDRPVESIRVVTPAVGGGFGGKVMLNAEYAVTAFAATRLNAPVRWTEQRGENLMTMHGRDHRIDVTLHATEEGRVTGLEVTSWTNAGAYPGFGCHIALTARAMAPGPYRIPYLRHELNCVATNTAPTGALRGAGRPEATHALERGMDMLAGRLGLDPAELRRRNLLSADQFPFTTTTGAIYDTGDYLRTLERALDLVQYDDLRAEQADRRRNRSLRLLGIGISTYVELSAAAPGIDGEFAKVEITPDGVLHAYVGTAAHGQGHRTVFAGILADLFQLPPESIEVVDGDTERVARGAGTGGSRSGQVGGSAILVAGEAVLAKARALAAHLLEASEDDLEVQPSIGLGVRGTPMANLTWAQLAAVAEDSSKLPFGMESGLRAAPGFQMAPGGTAPFGCHIAVVEVDAETGSVHLQRIVAVDDCGRILSPTLASGQVHGGLAAGIGQALFEHVQYDADGNPVNASFAEYLLPSAADLPSYETDHTVTPTPKNPLGAKGIGEAGTTGSLAAVHNAVIDALAHLGVRHLDLPLTPERVWYAIARSSMD